MIRTARLEDAAALAAIYAPYVTESWISFEEHPPDADEMRARMEAGLQLFPWLVSEGLGGEIDGYAYASAHRARAAYRWSADVTVYLRGDRARRGIGRALYEELLGLLMRQGFKAVFAGIALPNEASVALHEGVGFAPIGIYQSVGFKLGAWRDVGWWGRTLSDDEGPLSAPIPYSALEDKP